MIGSAPEITAENFWASDLREIESTFLEPGQKIADLRVSQEPLGAEFSRILNDNMWELYES